MTFLRLCSFFGCLLSCRADCELQDNSFLQMALDLERGPWPWSGETTTSKTTTTTATTTTASEIVIFKTYNTTTTTAAPAFIPPPIIAAPAVPAPAADHGEVPEQQNTTVIVVDGRNFTQLSDELQNASQTLGAAQSLVPVFEQSLLDVLSADQEVRQAELLKEDALKKIDALMNVTIDSSTNVDHHLIDSWVSDNGSKLVNKTVTAASASGRAAQLAQVVEEANGRIQLGLSRRDAALGKQTQTVEQIQSNLREVILSELNDTTLVQLLDASDRQQLAFPLSREATTTTTAKAASGQVLLYPMDWAIIGSLIVVAVLIAMMAIYSRSGDR
mmetsp:Transcript_58830/g.140089  ORF Transcript_58830/g.140089 Transcript_58830/m.140089 type:complete len:331 (+) Transcript_58830:94-1086(+)|eukprot:CAMPEP_0181439920 /NCGR_PEP_ID=MMETSP1110-20121109/22691_1 /TAXON_ID=174948 /ORGANISM="Symbiodinium sp., Strain CCMP421" /LENGTH=330 /DNA_ID=CAMNT_0023563689 /DNA_START=94 /DNA_END=1086 /DNA_ORIENTATION=+